MKKGFSLIEILVVIGLFALIGIVTTQAVLTSLKGSRIVDSETNIRQNIDYSMNIIERSLRNARYISDCSDPASIVYFNNNEQGGPQSISWTDTPDDKYISINNNRITSPQASITSFIVQCTPLTDTPVEITITIVATDPNATSDEAATITTTNKVVLRSNE